METAFQEALHTFLRWIHVVAGIMWIGDSFLFMWLDSHLTPPDKDSEKGRDPAIVGELWMTHSGGFYEVIKRKFLKQAEMGHHLYWFKWESYATWISGFFLLFVVYYLNGSSYLVDPNVRVLHPIEGILLSLGLLLGAWAVYDLLWSSDLKNRPTLLSLVCFGLLIGIAWWLTTVLSGRAAFLHVGAMMGTIMSSNVFFRIIPAQRNMLAATKAGTPVDTSLGLRAKMRSRHNHYMTLPVLFTMLSNHFPATYSHDHAWLVLAVVFIFGAGLKYLMNYKSQAGAGIWFATLASFFAFIWLTSERSVAVESEVDLMTRNAPFHEVERIIQNRCTTCHAKYPSAAAFKSPPAGVILETPADIVAYAPKILYRTYVTRTMPLANQTGITEDERATVAAWVQQGAKVEAAPRWEASPATEAELAEARAFYDARCVTCHGPEGRGDGPAAAGLGVKPASLRDHAWHFRTPDEALAKAIIEGGPAVGKHATMPPSLDLQDRKPLANALVKLVRGFEDKPPDGSPPPGMPGAAGGDGVDGPAR
jgi:uncharacterized membrane protein